MRLRNIKGADEVIEKSSFVIKNPEEYKGKWKDVFHNDNPIHMEIGMGKGQFIMELAEQNPNINYIGIEKFSSVLVRAIERKDNLEEKLDNLQNLLEKQLSQQEEKAAAEEAEKEAEILI